MFCRRNNYYQKGFFYPRIFDQLKAPKLNEHDRQILDKFEEGIFRWPIKYRYVSEKYGGGFDARRKILKGEFLGFFNGLILSLLQGN